MPAYEFECRKCQSTRTFFSPIKEGPPTGGLCSECGSDLRRIYGNIAVVANPVVWREENRISDNERKVINAKFEQYVKDSDAVKPQQLTEGKKFKSIYEAHDEAKRMFQTGEARGVTFAQARAEGIAT